MKIIRLDLRAFGPFTNETIDFSQCRSDFHVIYGPNEAGKSSALRALIYWLYGFPVRTSDAFLHPYERLRIGGILQGADGERLEFIRRKGRAKTMRGPDDRSVVDEAELRRLLPGIDESTFRQRFGIDYEQLRRGGEEIVQGGGDLAEVLFAAGAGLADLRSIEQELQTQLESLFKPSGSVPKINAALRSLKETQQQMRQAIVPTGEWERVEKELRTRQEQLKAVDRQLKGRRAEQKRLERVQQSLSLVGKRRQLRAQLQQVADAPRLRDTFSEERVQLQNQLQTARDAEREAREEIDRLQQLLEQTSVPQNLLQHSSAITALHAELGSVVKAAQDRPGLVAARERAQQEVLRLLQDLGKPPQLDHAATLRLPRDKRRRIQELASQYEARIQSEQVAVRTVGELERELQRLQLELEQTPDVPETKELERAIQRAERTGSLDEQYQQLAEELEQLRLEAEAALSRLTLFQGSLEELAGMEILSVETIDRFEEQLGEADKAIEQLSARIEEYRKRQRELTKQLRVLEAQQDVPTEESLDQARQLRDVGWQLVEQCWQTEGLPDETLQRQIQDFVDNFPGSSDLASAYRASVEAADALVDRLRREADRVARKVQWQAELERIEDELQELQRNLETAQAHHAQLLQQWRQQWQPVGIEPLTPREMRAWRDRQQELARMADQIRDRQRDLDHIRQRIDEHRAALAEALETCGLSEAVPSPDATLEEWLEECRVLVEQLRADRLRRERLLERCREAEERLEHARGRLAEATEQLKQWKTQWAEAVGALGLEADADPLQATTVMEAIDEVVNRMAEIQSLSGRIEGIDRDAEDYRQRVRQLLIEAAPDLVAVLDKSIQQTVSDLADRLAQAQKDQQRLEDLQTRLNEQQEKLRRAQQAIQSAERRLRELCMEAGCDSVSALRDVEERSQRRRELELRLEPVEEQLAGLAAGKGLEEWVQELQGYNVDQVEAQLQALEVEIAELEEQQRELSTEIGQRRNELARMDGSDQAARLQEQVEFLLAEIRADAEQYIRLRLAQEVLLEAMQRFRQRSQGPVLQRASEIFRKLTLESFVSVQADVDERGNARLVGVRPGGEVVGVEGMSDGTADQLFLALRLAMLETTLQGREPIPFVVDDVLIMFDDDRAAAALEVLAELADTTQVIYFTHHKHIVELARQRLAEHQWCLHELAAAPVAAAAH